MTATWAGPSDLNSGAQYLNKSFQDSFIDEKLAPDKASRIYNRKTSSGPLLQSLFSY